MTLNKTSRRVESFPSKVSSQIKTMLLSDELTVPSFFQALKLLVTPTVSSDFNIMWHNILDRDRNVSGYETREIFMPWPVHVLEVHSAIVNRKLSAHVLGFCDRQDVFKPNWFAEGEGSRAAGKFTLQVDLHALFSHKYALEENQTEAVSERLADLREEIILSNYFKLRERFGLAVDKLVIPANNLREFYEMLSKYADNSQFLRALDSFCNSNEEFISWKFDPKYARNLELTLAEVDATAVYDYGWKVDDVRLFQAFQSSL